MISLQKCPDLLIVSSKAPLVLSPLPPAVGGALGWQSGGLGAGHFPPSSLSPCPWKDKLLAPEPWKETDKRALALALKECGRGWGPWLTEVTFTVSGQLCSRVGPHLTLLQPHIQLLPDSASPALEPRSRKRYVELILP